MRRFFNTIAIAFMVYVFALSPGCGGSASNIKKAVRGVMKLKRVPPKVVFDRDLKLKLSLNKKGGVDIKYGPVRLDVRMLRIARSTSDIKSLNLLKNFSYLELGVYPVTAMMPPNAYVATSTAERDMFEIDCEDNNVGANAKYHYQMEIIHRSGRRVIGPVVSIETPKKKLPKLIAPWIHIDKLNYVLWVMEGDERVKGYPFVMGRKPRSRKLHQDGASTPEGIYRIYNLQPNATYYKAYDIDYPNSMDKFRYNIALQQGWVPKSGISPVGIGGEIQIHGKSINSNWTAGCVALRKDDIDELFEQKEIRVGTKVVFTGKELTMEDLDSIAKSRSTKEVKAIQRKLKKAGFDPGPVDGRLGGKTMAALGRFQESRGMPFTCQLDAGTVKVLGKIRLKDDSGKIP